MTGILSPVSIASLMIILPVRTIASHGMIVFVDGTSITSPGTRLALFVSLIYPLTKVLIGREYLAIFLI